MLDSYYVDVYQYMFMMMLISARNKSKNLYLAKYSIVQKLDLFTMWTNIFWPFFKKIKATKDYQKKKSNLHLSVAQICAHNSKKIFKLNVGDSNGFFPSA